MSTPGSPWWIKETLTETLRAAQEVPVTKSLLKRVLPDQTFTDADERRVQAVIEAGLPHLDEQNFASHPETLAHSPRELTDRHFDVVDAAYLTDRELARVIAVGLQRLRGTSHVTWEAEIATDVVWNESHISTALQVVACADDDPLDDAVVRAVTDGDVTPASGRAPSIVAIVTNGEYTPAARTFADAEDIQLVDGGLLQQWFDLFRLTPDLYGPALEEPDVTETDLEELLEDAPTVPNPFQEADLFDLADNDCRPPAREPTIRSKRGDVSLPAHTAGYTGTVAHARNGAAEIDVDEGSGAPADVSLDESEVKPGEYGKLYADPDEDGDFDAIDDLLSDAGEDR